MIFFLFSFFGGVGWEGREPGHNREDTNSLYRRHGSETYTRSQPGDKPSECGDDNGMPTCSVSSRFLSLSVTSYTCSQSGNAPTVEDLCLCHLTGEIQCPKFYSYQVGELRRPNLLGPSSLSPPSARPPLPRLCLFRLGC